MKASRQNLIDKEEMQKVEGNELDLQKPTYAMFISKLENYWMNEVLIQQKLWHLQKVVMQALKSLLMQVMNEG